LSVFFFTSSEQKQQCERQGEGTRHIDTTNISRASPHGFGFQKTVAVFALNPKVEFCRSSKHQKHQNTVVGPKQEILFGR